MAEGEQLHLPPRRCWHLKSATFRSTLRIFSLLPPLPCSTFSSPHDLPKEAKEAASMVEWEEGEVHAPSTKKERGSVGKKETLSDSSKGKRSKLKDVDFTAKKKRIITEERKAKKKLAKKRKRAETNRKLGVKKLKIMPVSMPKKVIYCNFYLKGRCQQGSSCRYSHDTTPLTKSQPCKHFACNSCLKGDECPFDHDLGKYSCHNFMEKGFCRRGETCKFSHKISSTENAAVGISKHDSLLPTKNLFSSNHLTKDVPAQSVVRDVTGSSMLEPLASTCKSKMAQKSPLKAPKGICFLSFDNSLSRDTADRPQIVPPSGVGHAIGMPGHQNNVEPSVLQRSSDISAAMPPSVCPPSLWKQNASISKDSRASVRSTFETAAARVTNSPFPGFLPGKTTGKGIANICNSSSPGSCASGGATQSRTAGEAARLLDEFLFHGST